MLKWLLAIVILAVVSGLGSSLSPRRWRFGHLPGFAVGQPFGKTIQRIRKCQSLFGHGLFEYIAPGLKLQHGLQRGFVIILRQVTKWWRCKQEGGVYTVTAFCGRTHGQVVGCQLQRTGCFHVQVVYFIQSFVATNGSV